MYCSLDKIDLVANIAGRPVAVQTDHRELADIEREPELATLYALSRVLNAREHMETEGQVDAPVHYVVSDAPPFLRTALAAVGATLEHPAHEDRELLGDASAPTAGALADDAFAALARRAAQRAGTRDLAMALRMVEDQTWAAPPTRDDEPAYWSRVLELAALAGELLRAKYPTGGRWVQCDRALVPFGFQLTAGTLVFPTNRAQRLVEDGRDESLFKLLLAADEALASPPDAATGRLMPSLRARSSVDPEATVWSPLLREGERTRDDLPIVVCGIDGENTFGMVRKEALAMAPDEALRRALENLADEPTEIEEMHADGMLILVVTGTFYAAEKLLDAAFMRSLHDELGAYMLAAATPARGLLLVTDAGESGHLARFAALARLRHDDSGGRAISPAVVLVTDGKVTASVGDERDEEGISLASRGLRKPRA